MDSEYPYLDAVADNRSAQIVTVESSKLLPWLMLCAMLSGFAVAFSLFTFYQLTRTEREYRLAQLQLMDQNAILIREGLKQPTDLTNGPAGNYQYDPSKSPKRKGE